MTQYRYIDKASNRSCSHTQLSTSISLSPLPLQHEGNGQIICVLLLFFLFFLSLFLFIDNAKDFMNSFCVYTYTFLLCYFLYVINDINWCCFCFYSPDDANRD